MKITIVSVGTLKEKYWRDAVSEYTKRLRVYAKQSIIEVPEEKAPDKTNPAIQASILQKEGSRILNKIHVKDFVVILCVDGKSISSEAFADFLEMNMANGANHVVFVIGGSLGLSKEVVERADFQLSFSAFTFPHQLMRVLLLEQIYRGFKILRGEPYHK